MNPLLILTKGTDVGGDDEEGDDVKGDDEEGERR